MVGNMEICSEDSGEGNERSYMVCSSFAVKEVSEEEGKVPRAVPWQEPAGSAAIRPSVAPAPSPS